MALVSMSQQLPYTFKELGMKTLPDFEKLAAKQGWCWCIYYQRPGPLGKGSPKEWARRNRRDKRKLIREGRSHAILVYEGREPVGWCQYGTREELPRIDAGRNYRKVAQPSGEAPLWRITCFFVDRRHRNKGVSKVGLHAALESIGRKGGGTVEAYPVVSRKMAAIPEWRWFGTPSMFEREGFSRVAPLGTSLMLMRKTVAGT
jgi:GNAT superfamily N-acetyltransferase